ncbi:hypothetical protein Tco_1335174 [Tanacetum coccineum]
MGELAKDEITDKFPDEHLMILKAKLNDEEPWEGCLAGNMIILESLGTLAILGPIGDITVPRLQEERFTKHDYIGPLGKSVAKILGSLLKYQQHITSDNVQTKSPTRAIKRILGKVGQPKDWSKNALMNAIVAF